MDDVAAVVARSEPSRGADSKTRAGLAPIPLAYYVDAWVAAKCTTGQMVTSSARRARRNLYLFCRFAPDDPRQVGKEHVEQFLQMPDVIASHRADLANLRGLFDYLIFRGIVVSNPTVEVQPPKPAPKLQRDIATTIADALDGDVLDARSSLVISLMFCEGVRRCEIARLQLQDIDSPAGVIKIRGKGGYGLVKRVVPISPRTARALAAYRATTDRRRGPLIVSLVSPEFGLSVAHVGIIARRALESLGIKRSGGDGVTPQSLLHTIAPDEVQAELDLR